jgi:F-type H+-transporting ATPase subunit delta
MRRAGSAARRYAEAVFQLAERDKSLDRWAEDLRLAAQFSADPDLAKVVNSPLVQVAELDELLERLLAKRISAPALNLVRLLARRGKLELLGPISAEYQRLLNASHGVISALVTSAKPLDRDEDKAIRGRIAEMTGATVDVETAVDPALIGGLTVRIGDRLIDASVRGRLERLRAQLLAGTRQAG